MAMLEETTKVTKKEESQDKTARDAGPDTVIPIAEDLPRKFVPKAPLPKRLMAPKKGSKFDYILEVFKQVQISIPF